WGEGGGGGGGGAGAGGRVERRRRRDPLPELVRGRVTGGRDERLEVGEAELDRQLLQHRVQVGPQPGVLQTQVLPEAVDRVHADRRDQRVGGGVVADGQRQGDQ